MTDGLSVGDDGAVRCWWPGSDALYSAYHDEEWGRGTTDDRLLFEKICLEGFQAGLAWITILRKRENFRAAFADFDFRQLAGWGSSEVERLVADAGIVRHRGKIESTLNNAALALELIDEHGSIHDFVSRFAPSSPAAPQSIGDIPAKTAESTALSKALKQRGWSFVGPTTMYAFMQAMGLVNDHLVGCDFR